jgi:predicted lipid-binding transport protein (Tim44 family)
MQNIDVSTVVLALVALFVVFKLRSVLGMRNEADRRRADASAQSRNANNITPSAVAYVAPNPAANANVPANRWAGVAEPGSPVWNGLDAIAAADPAFSAAPFLTGARAAYEMVVTAFAAGDSATLRNVLAPEVYDNFNKAILARRQAGQTMSTTLIAIDAADIVGARLAEMSAQVSVRFSAKLVSVTRNSAGAVVDGSPDTIGEHHDIWTFGRDVRSRDPNWSLSATEAVH